MWPKVWQWCLVLQVQTSIVSCHAFNNSQTSMPRNDWACDLLLPQWAPPKGYLWPCSFYCRLSGADCTCRDHHRLVSKVSFLDWYLYSQAVSLFTTGVQPYWVILMDFMVAKHEHLLMICWKSSILRLYWMSMEFTTTFWYVLVCINLFIIFFSDCKFAALYSWLSVSWHLWNSNTQLTSPTYKRNLQGPSCHLGWRVSYPSTWRSTSKWNPQQHWQVVCSLSVPFLLVHYNDGQLE